ncbi:MAG: hypothetical protein ACI935_001637 [Moritella dasanensis]|jgi:hypothetical protein
MEMNMNSVTEIEKGVATLNGLDKAKAKLVYSGLAVRNRASWDAIWHSVVTCYWNDIEQFNAESNIESPVQYFKTILDKLNVENAEIVGDEYIGLKCFEGNDSLLLKLTANLNSETSFDTNTAFSDKNSWKNLSATLVISIPPADIVNPDEQLSVLSDYTSLGLYFPFGTDYKKPYKTENDTLIEDMLKLTGSQALFMGSANSSPAVASGESGDRGGAYGIDEDYRWIQFVPRLIAYNWMQNKEEQLVDGCILNEKSELLDIFGYKIPDGLKVIVKYAKTKPLEEINGIKAWNMNDYVSALTIDIPLPPSDASYKPIALADLMATRANQPFTCI